MIKIKDNSGHYRRFILGTWPQPSPEKKRLQELAREYHEATESYDKQICSATRNGMAFPANGLEHSLISIHARNVYASLIGEVHSLGFDSMEFNQEILLESQRMRGNR